jgi:hypothetical protein
MALDSSIKPDTSSTNKLFLYHSLSYRSPIFPSYFAEFTGFFSFSVCTNVIGLPSGSPSCARGIPLNTRHNSVA